jgi:L-amino acid N-acyltransferase YncA
MAVVGLEDNTATAVAGFPKNGFRECGRFERAGRKNEQDFDIVWMQRRLT